MTSPSGRRAAVRALTCRGISERRACQILGLSRRVSSYALRQPGKDQALGTRLMDATQDVPRFGYRRMAAWLDVGEARVRRLWRSLGLHQPRKRPRRRRSGCDMRLPGAVRPNSVWSYDFVHLIHGVDQIVIRICLQHLLRVHIRTCSIFVDLLMSNSELHSLFNPVNPRISAAQKWLSKNNVKFSFKIQR